MKPLLSIVIANYNYGRFLEEAIHSVIAQGMGDKVELIICDGSSTDNSVEIIKKYACGLPPNVERHTWREALAAGAKTPSSNQKEKTDGERQDGSRNRDHGAAGRDFRDGIHQGLPAGLCCKALDDESCLRLFGAAHPLGPHGAFEHDPPAAIRAASERIERIARENGVFLSDEMLRSIVKGHRKVRRSGESEVYLDVEAKRYIKLYDPFSKMEIRHGRADEVIYNIVAHNLLFPETRYTFVGVAHGANGIRFVLLQDEVESIQTVDENQIASFLELRLCLVKDGRYSFGNDYYSITDIGASSDNVLLDKNGKLKFIDPIIVFKRPVDEVVAYISSNSQLISWWCSEPDGGQSAAFNKGFSHARGRFLTWLNADDVMLPGVLKKLGRAVEKHPDCEWFVGGCFWLDPKMRIINCGRGRPFSEIRYREGNVGVWGPSSFFTKQLLDSVGGVDERFHFSMDTDLWLRFAAKANARYLPFCKYAWGLRLHPEAKMSGHNFTPNGEFDTKHSEAEKKAASKFRQQRENETSLRMEYFKPRKQTCLSRIVSVCWTQVLCAKLDLLRFKGKHYMEYFK